MESCENKKNIVKMTSIELPLWNVSTYTPIKVTSAGSEKSVKSQASCFRN